MHTRHCTISGITACMPDMSLGLSFLVCCCWIVALPWRGCNAANLTSASVYWNGSAFQVKSQVDKMNAIAYGMYKTSLNDTGWNELHIAAGYSAHQFSDEDVMTAAGILEGFLTQQDIHTLFSNMYTATFTGKTASTMSGIKDFYSQQREWAEGMVKSKASTSDYWYYTGLLLAQFKGLQIGYAMAAPPGQELEAFAFDFLSGNGDCLDIMNFVSPEDRPDVTKLTKEELLTLLHRGRCSGFIKVLPGYENIFAGHSTWYMYSAMNRVYKHYAIKVAASGRKVVPATKVMSFSSYPGYLSSLDDFLIMDSGLVMIQTTNGIFNKTLYDLSTPKALLAWHRVRLANWLASSGEEWANYVSQYNSGTYNNQYMVLDMKKVELKKAIQDGALWVVEQIPGYMKSGDQTDILRAGYWSSYNIPFYEDIYNMSGYFTAFEAHGTDFSYGLCPRAKIFRRDQGKVVDMESMKYIMRYNDYKNDPYSLGNPMNAICSRADLQSPPRAGGCFDTKVTDYDYARQQQALAMNGPTYQGLPPFDWKTTALTVPHIGQPEVFNFNFTLMLPAVP